MAKSRSIGGIYASLSLRDGGFARGLKRAEKGLNTFARSSVKYAAAGTAALGGALAAGLVVVGKRSVAAASDMSETLSKSNVVFGKNSEAMQAWAGNAAKSFGQSKQEALGAAATMGNMFLAMGQGQDEAAEMSKSMVELAADMASFNNTSSEDAITAIGAALRGESEPIRRYGVLLDDATLKAQALAMGLYDGKGALTPATRALAAYQVILKQTTTAQGDFARTADGLANSQKIIKASIDNAIIGIGNGLLPAVQNLANVAKGINFEEFGKRVGESLSTTFEIITDGKM